MLPAEVTATIDGATILERHGDPIDGPNILFLPCGTGGFRYDRDAAAKWLSETFPELDATQVERATRYIGSRVRAQLVESARAQAAANGRRSWDSWNPLGRMSWSE